MSSSMLSGSMNSVTRVQSNYYYSHTLKFSTSFKPKPPISPLFLRKFSILSLAISSMSYASELAAAKKAASLAARLCQVILLLLSDNLYLYM